MIEKAIRALAAAALLAVLTVTAAQAVVVNIAKNDGTANFNAATYLNGYGTSGDANYVSLNLSDYDGLGSDAMIRLTMGNVIDFFKPVAGKTLLEMLTSNTDHLWSESATGPFIAPAYSSAHLGGSAHFWPALNAAGDNRAYLGFWGTNGGFGGGCCTQNNDGSTSWGQSFSMDLISAVPLPGGLPLVLTGLAAFGLIRRGRRDRV